MDLIEIRSPQNEQEWENYYEIRYKELREPWQQPRGSEKDSSDAQATHFALFVNGEMAGVLRMDSTEDPAINQFRFMAISNCFQGKKLGYKLLHTAEKEAIKRNKSKIILQAREKAISFYQRGGYKIVKKSHLLFGEIQHFMMEKELPSSLK